MAQNVLIKTSIELQFLDNMILLKFDIQPLFRGTLSINIARAINAIWFEIDSIGILCVINRFAPKAYLDPHELRVTSVAIVQENVGSMYTLGETPYYAICHEKANPSLNVEWKGCRPHDLSPTTWSLLNAI